MKVVKKIHQLEPFKRYLVYSLVAHVMLALFFTAKNHIFKEDDLIIKSAIQVDVVALPDKAKPDIPAKNTNDNVATPEPEPKKTDKVQPVVEKDKQLSAFQKLEALKKIEQMKKQNEALERLKNLKNKQDSDSPAKADSKPSNNDSTSTADPEPKLNAGNIIEPNQGLSGLDKLQMDRYFEEVRQHIQNNFIIPSFIDTENISGKADIRIDRTGVVIFRVISFPSGNDIFDKAILASIDRSSPLPTPPSRLQSRLENQGFRLGFPD